MFGVHSKNRAMTIAVFLGTLPATAHAQYVPTWLIFAILSPILVFFLCIILGLITRSLRIGALHAAFVFAWIVLFSLASYFIENDYVIWTPLALYTLHAALLLVLIVVAIAKRISGDARTA
nr:putative integron gene cassette protein [uncultured bacterium]